MFWAITDLILNTEVFKIPAIVRLYQIQTPLRPRWRNSWLSEDAAIFTDVDRVKNTRFISRNLIYTKDFTLSAVGIAIEYHIAAQPRTPFCHYVAFHQQGSVSLDSQSPAAPCESSSLATSRGNKKFEEKNRESYTSCTTPAFPLWWLAPLPFPRKREHNNPCLL